jgi:RNA polymerase sigma-70 factor (ECF subfamily)
MPTQKCIDLEEQDAVRRCQDGDREAFRFVVDQYGGVLYGMAYSMTRDWSLSEDLVQETYILAWVNFASFELGSNLQAWLLRILVNRTISAQRKRRVTQVNLESGAAALTIPDSAVESLISTEERERIGRCLETLSFEHRLAVVLRYYADLTGPEIAKTLGWREGTVRSRLHRALAKLRPLLREQDFQDESVCDKA